MSIQNVIDRKEGNVGDRRKHTNGLYYVKARNGKWQLEISPRLVSKVRSLYVKEKLNLREVGQRLGICHSTVSSIVNDNGFGSGKRDIIHANKNILEKHKKEITRMYTKQGMSFKEIADHLDTRWQLVGSYIKSLGIKRSAKEQNQLCSLKASVFGTSYKLFNSPPAKVFSSFSEYKAAVYSLSNSVYRRYKHILDPENLRSSTFHIDHQLSVFSGWYEYCSKSDYFKRSREIVPLNEICHPANLKLLLGSTNGKKGSNNHLTRNTLRRQIRKFEKEHGKVFK